MKTKASPLIEEPNSELAVAHTIPLVRAKEIISEEGIDFTDEELTQVLQFVSKVVSITTSHHERTKQNETKVISINTNTTHETTSLSLHPREHRRAS